jgi:hypothetical protein
MQHRHRLSSVKVKVVARRQSAKEEMEKQACKMEGQACKKEWEACKLQSAARINLIKKSQPRRHAANARGDRPVRNPSGES